MPSTYVRVVDLRFLSLAPVETTNPSPTYTTVTITIPVGKDPVGVAVSPNGCSRAEIPS